ncbi:zinc ribbon domain-containing protein [Candidatus Thorarchaeota archaeon]|nr:MAG: zinc ribbon domain-containing protein [Candidatus Thorarchaeota archaeon]
MRNCEKCGKANQPTRKYCIRCGTKLVRAPKPAPERAPLPTAEAKERSRVIVGSETAQQETKAEETPSTTTGDQWVKPSEVARDRVRHAAGSSKRKSELEKAKEAFARAETVGIDEEGTGVIETRMLRASEVKELLEGPGMMEGSEEFAQPQMMPGSEPLPPEAAATMQPAAPSQSQIEKQILGSKSGFVEEEAKPPEPPAAAPPGTGPPAASVVSADFSSAKYEEASEVPAQPTAAPAPAPPPEKPPAAPTPETDDSLDLVIACPSCGHVMNVDMFEYPNEVYSSMGDARLKQARYFIVQGKPNDARRVIGVARALYEKGASKTGLAEAKKILDSLDKKA